jgi:hypothetical protein
VRGQHFSEPEATVSASPRRARDVVTPRRLVTTALLLLAVVLSVVGLQSVRDNRAASCSYGVIVKLYPCPGDTDLRQGRVGVDMSPGWQVDLYVDNTAVPRDQLSAQGSSFSYAPGPGTATGALAPGHHTARVVYYQNIANEATAQQFAWNFSAS